MAPRKTRPAAAKMAPGTKKAQCMLSVDEDRQKPYKFISRMKGKAKTPMAFVAYFRVSTTRQGRSGLGLEAQRTAVENYLAQFGGKLVGEFIEVESGTNPARPQLEAALQTAKLYGAGLLVGKLDRLGRKAWHLLRLLDESTVPIRFADAPDADETMLGMMAIFAQREAKLISERTKAALAAAKKRGQALGSARPGHWTPARDRMRKAALARGREKAMQQRSAEAAQFRARVLPVLLDLRSKGLSYRAIAAELESRGIPTAQQKSKWTAAQVRVILVESEGAK